MGRPETPVDASTGAVAAFASDLRQLRRRAGSPTYREMARSAMFSSSVLSSAASGRRLPTLQVTLAFVTACGGDQELWRHRWLQVFGGDHDSAAAPTKAIAPKDGAAPLNTAGPAGAQQPPAAVRGAVGELKHCPPTPAQLPCGMTDFTGREPELERLNALLDPGPDQCPGVVIAAIAGTAGVGKTALAVHWAHQISHRFPDGQLYVNLRGFDQNGAAVEPGEAIRGFLDAFGVPTQQIPAKLDDQAALYRSLLAGRQVLVLLDNARDTDQLRPLLPGAPGCVVIVTSRNQLSGLVTEGAVAVPVDLLTAAEARDLLVRRIGWSRVESEPDAVDDIIAECARLPLALAIVAARAAVHPQFSLAAIAEELRESRGGLDAFVGETATSDARAVLSWSYHLLGAGAARLFRQLGLHPGPDLTVPAAASLVGLPPARVRRLLTELCSAHLLAQHTPGRFAFHDLLRAYAAEQASLADSAAESSAALARVLDHYLHTSHAADRVLYAYRKPLPIDPPDPAVTIVEIPDAEGARAWFTAEHLVLVAAIDTAARHDLHAYVRNLAWVITAFLNYHGHWRDWASIQRIALESSRCLGDRDGQALAYRLLNVAYLQQGLLDEADGHAQSALRLYRELDDRPGQARIHLDLGRVRERQGSLAQALEQAQQALKLYQLTGEQAGEADALNWVGWYHSRLGHHTEALTYCEQSLELHEQVGHWSAQIDTWGSLGYAHHQLGHHDEARACYERALALWQRIGDRFEVATTLIRLGDTLCTAGDAEAAHARWGQAAVILDELGHPSIEQIRAALEPAEAEQRAGGPVRPS